jgi:hypothetical protein
MYLHALVGSGYEGEATEIVVPRIGSGLGEYDANRNAEEAWKAKDGDV